ncbi:MAG: alpha-1,4-glucan--maltose-1-phosphate maltosyltransferase [Spirochaetales bacterium]|nr:alpha-1,4-glucan--maltose-1-phosphate maltosyltransferase [Spirochaetales bacterium]
MVPQINNVVIQNVKPEIDNGENRVKLQVNDFFTVSADIFSHGHELLQARLLYRRAGEKKWNEARMALLENDRWEGFFQPDKIGYYEYTIIAWRDLFLSWANDLEKKYKAKQDIINDLLEGKALVEAAMNRAPKNEAAKFKPFLVVFDRQIEPQKATDTLLDLIALAEEKMNKGQDIKSEILGMKNLVESVDLERKWLSPEDDPVLNIILNDELKELMIQYADRSQSGQYEKTLQLECYRKAAEFSAWYEMFHRSQGTQKGESATFKDMINRIPEIEDMGFDVIYLPPVHPIGLTNRKGPNNSLTCPPGSPGCPWAIGNSHGGHTAINPELGTLEDFKLFVEKCKQHSIEVALDLALQTSPDHPWVKKHPQWFVKRSDGTIKFAENPPKKYEDIYPINFNTEDRENLWNEILEVCRFWINLGIKIFRVDNPHTKPVYFWKWLIDSIHENAPDVIFLSEAFTRPKMMKTLAKIGFTQSYTYFTWRNSKWELTDYHKELTQDECASYMIGNLFTNTPDILPEVLQNAPRSAFKMRAALAATLSSTWGIYNGFELCEGTPLPGKEEYLNSEKYQYKVWDWDRPGNIKDFIKKLNLIRKQNPALHRYRNLEFYQAENDNILFYGKADENVHNIILVVVNLDPYKKQESYIYLPLEKYNIKANETYQVLDLISGQRFYWQGTKNFISLDPDNQPCHIFRILKWSHREQDFDYFF